MTSKTDPVAQLQQYLEAFNARDAARIAGCFTDRAILELPTIKPNRLIGQDEIKTAHLLAFENVEQVVVETDLILSAEHAVMSAGRLTVNCRGLRRTHAFGISVESSATGLDRASWYFDARGERSWSDKTVL